MYFNTFDKNKISFKIFNNNKKENIIILHGWTARGSFYYFLKRYLDFANLIIWDARGHGDSFKDKDASIEKIAIDLRVLIENLNLNNLTVIGHSMGALTLFEYFSQFEEPKIDRIVIIDQSPKLITDNDWNLGLYGNFTHEDNKKLIKEFEEDLSIGLIKLSYAYGINEDYRKMYNENFELLYSNRRIFDEEQKTSLINIWKTFSVKDYRPVLNKIKIPTLLIYGGKSQFYKRETGLYMKNNISNSRLVYFEDQDHSPLIGKPALFKNEVYDFIKGV